MAAPQDAIFALLADMPGHWALSNHWTEVCALDADGGTIRLQGPFGIRRTARVRVHRRDAPELVEGEARLGAVTRAQVAWTLEPSGPRGTSVTLSARVERASWADRLLLAAGGRAWLRWRFAATLRRLEPALGVVSTAA